MLKQWYANQLHDHSNVSIVKTLLLQMPNMSFTQYRNELARVLRTHQCSGKAVLSKSVSVSAAGAESEEEEQSVSKSQCKQEKKISAQSSQIKDLCTKLDGAIAENTQIRELLTLLHYKLLSPMLCRLCNLGHMGLEVSFWGRSENQSLQQAKMGQQTQIRLATIARIWVKTWTIAHVCKNIEHFSHIRISLWKG